MSLLKAVVLTTMLSHVRARGPVAFPEVESPPIRESGVASWYGMGRWHGDVTASGERFDPQARTCAHRSLPFHTVVLVENRSNGRRAWCRVNDRGPYAADRENGSWGLKTDQSQAGRWRAILDLSIGMAEELRMREAGLQRVNLRYWKSNSNRWYPLAFVSP